MRLNFVYSALIVIVISSGIFATTLNGRFLVIKSDSSRLSVLLQINTNTGDDDLGGATIVLSFDKSVLSFSSDPVENRDFKFSGFSGGNYNDATVTKPLIDKLWINIDLPSDNNNKGAKVSGLSTWTDLVTLNFDVKDPGSVAKIKWQKNNVFWQIYDADNSTNWSTGELTDLIKSPQKTELVKFTAVLLDESDIKLDWSTISYGDEQGYDIERSDIKSSSWEKIGHVEGKNILNTQVDYSFTDSKANTSSNLKYRLKSISADATYTLLGEVELNLAPQKFELSQNYPNPFNPSTKIRYILPQTANANDQMSRVLLKVYDILGNEVATLVNESQESGQHEIEFNGSGLASGIYIYRLDTPSFHDTKKMLLLK